MKRFIDWASIDLADWRPAHYAFFGTITATATAALAFVAFVI